MNNERRKVIRDEGIYCFYELVLGLWRLILYCASPPTKRRRQSPPLQQKGKRKIQSHRRLQFNRKSRKASEEDWTAVRAIAQECAKKIGHTVALREKLKSSEYYERFGGNACSPELIAKYNKVNFAFSRAARKVRDLEREQWAKIAKYLSPYELRKYKLEHSQFAHDLRRETK